MIREALKPKTDIVDVRVSISDKTVRVKHNDVLSPQALVDILNGIHMGASLHDMGEVGQFTKSWSWRECLNGGTWAIQLLLLSSGLALEFLAMAQVGANIAYLVCVALSWPLFKKAWLALLRRKANVEFLMAAAMIGSMLQGATREAAMVGTIVTIMHGVTWMALQAVDARLNRCIAVPPTMISLQGGRRVPAAELLPGMVFVVRAGETIMADGTITSGEGTVDESQVTGEAMPVSKAVGGIVCGGAILQAGYLEVRADSAVEESFQNQLLDAVREAKHTQSGIELIVEFFAGWYTPSVIIIAAAVALFQQSFTQFLVIIVAGCPCAILGATPFV